MRELAIYEIGLSGKCGDEVFYYRWNKTKVRKAAGSYNMIPTVKQAPIRFRFKAAQRFGKMVISDPQLKAYFESIAGEMRTAYNKAISEYMKGNVVIFTREPELDARHNKTVVASRSTSNASVQATTNTTAIRPNLDQHDYDHKDIYHYWFPSFSQKAFNWHDTST